jgi:hypothetical protein
VGYCNHRMDDAALYTRIYFEMLDAAATLYQDAANERIAKPLNSSLEENLKSFIDNKMSMMRLDVDRSKELRGNLDRFRNFVIHEAIPDHLVTLSHIAHKNKIVKMSDDLKLSIVNDFNITNKKSASGSLSVDSIKRSNGAIVPLLLLQKVALQEKIDEIKDFRPNDPDQIAFRDDQLAFLMKVRDSIDAVVQIKTIQKPNLEAVGLLEAFITWWNQHNQKVVGWSVGVPAAAVGVGILQLAGVPVAYSLAALTTLAGGGKVSGMIKELRDK